MTENKGCLDGCLEHLIPIVASAVMLFSIIYVPIFAVKKIIHYSQERRHQQHVEYMTSLAKENGQHFLTAISYIANHAGESDTLYQQMQKQLDYTTCWNDDCLDSSLLDSAKNILAAKLASCDSLENRLAYLHLQENIGDLHFKAYVHRISEPTPLAAAQEAYTSALTACLKPKSTYAAGDTVTADMCLPKLVADQERLNQKLVMATTAPSHRTSAADDLYFYSPKKPSYAPTSPASRVMSRARVIDQAVRSVVPERNPNH